MQAIERLPEVTRNRGKKSELPPEFRFVEHLVGRLDRALMVQVPADISVTPPPPHPLLFQPQVSDLFGLQRLRHILNDMETYKVDTIKAELPDGWTRVATRRDRTLALSVTKEGAYSLTTLTFDARIPTDTIDRRTSTPNGEVYRACLILPLERDYHHIILGQERRHPDDPLNRLGRTVEARCYAYKSGRTRVDVNTKNHFDGTVTHW